MGGDYWWYKNHGICTTCHAASTDNGRSRCLDCRLKALSYTQEHLALLSDASLAEIAEQKKAYGKKRYHKLKEQGICVDCGKRQAVNGVRCTTCRLLNNYRRRKYKDYDRR